MCTSSLTLPEPKSKRVELSGLAHVLGYLTLTAFYGIFISETLKPGADWNVFAFLFLSFAAVAVFFGVSVVRSQSFASRAWGQRKAILEVNFATIVLWLGYFLGLSNKKISPAMFIAVAVGGGPLYLMIWRYVDEKVRPTKKQLWKSTIFGAGAVALFAFETLPSKGLAVACVLAVASGFGFIWLTRSTVKLNQAGWGANEVLAVRFWLLLMISGACWLFSGAPAAPGKAVDAMLVDLLISAGVGHIAALYLLHKGIKLLPNREKIAIFTAALPLIMYGLQFCVPNPSFSSYSLIGLSLVVFSQLIK